MPSSRTHGTHLRPATRLATRGTHGLQDLLAQSFQSYRDTHLAHFNVTGQNFPQLHALFEGQYQEIWEALDLIAERIRALGEPVADTAFAVDAATLPKGDMAIVSHLAEQHHAVANTCAAVQQAAEKAGDMPTADLANQRMLAHQKHAWLLDATST